jgi:hypothetical protein
LAKPTEKNKSAAAWSAAESAAESALSAARSAEWSAEAAARSAAKKKLISALDKWFLERIKTLESYEK